MGFDVNICDGLEVRFVRPSELKCKADFFLSVFFGCNLKEIYGCSAQILRKELINFFKKSQDIR